MFANLIFPTAASTVASEVDAFYWFLVGLTLFFTVGIAIAVLVFAIKYRRRPGNETGAHIEGSTPLELFWSGVPFLIAMFIFAWSASILFKISRPPDNSMDIFVVGKQWMWKVQHMEGRREINQLHIPVGRPVKITLTSEDVIHSFYVPAFRVKSDAVPGRYSTVWFQATKTGSYHLFCAEYCGTEHSRMIGEVIVMEPADYEAWLAQGRWGATPEARGQTPTERGRDLFAANGCNTCHSNNRAEIGPRLVGLYGTEVELADGSTAKVDDAYLRESILDPLSKITRGYKPDMPTFRGRLNEEEVMSLISYIKSLSATEDDTAKAEESDKPHHPESAPPAGTGGDL